jgi:hypothetical protein
MAKKGRTNTQRFAQANLFMLLPIEFFEPRPCACLWKAYSFDLIEEQTVDLAIIERRRPH